MKAIKSILAAALAVCFIATASSVLAEDKKDAVKPYPLDKCIVSDEKLGADSGMKTFSFVHEGQEIKLCCKPCQKDFNKNPAKYLKKLEGAGASDKK